MNNLQQRVVLSGATVLILGLGFVSLITLLPKSEITRAREVQSKNLAINNISLEASLLPKSEINTVKKILPKKVVIDNNRVKSATWSTPRSELYVKTSLLSKAKITTTKKSRPKKLTRANSWLAASFPVENFQAYTSPFGYRLAATGGTNWEFHGGLDIAAPQGSYIRNWWAGTVIKVSDGDACGTHIVIKSGEWEHTYCHMEGQVETASERRYMIDRTGGIQIWEGEQIPTGARIGRVGMTGRTTGPHLHWGLKYSNNYVDPSLILREMFSQQQVARESSKVTPQQSRVIIEESKSIRDAGY